MDKRGPIVIVKNDQDDCTIFRGAFDSLHYPNELIFCANGQEALDILRRGDFRPFMVISDINIPRIDGLEFKILLQEDPAIIEKCIPYIVYSTAVVETQVCEAYKESVQGFFRKPNTIEELTDTIRVVVHYWKLSV